MEKKKNIVPFLDVMMIRATFQIFFSKIVLCVADGDSYLTVAVVGFSVSIISCLWRSCGLV